VLLQPYREALDIVPASEHKYITNRCLMALYFPLLMTTGYGFANDSEHIHVRYKIRNESPGIGRVPIRISA